MKEDAKQKAIEKAGKAVIHLTPALSPRGGEGEESGGAGITIKAGELAARLQVSERTVRKMVALKQIPVVRIGRLLRFCLPEVMRALTESAIKSPDGAGTVGGPRA